MISLRKNDFNDAELKYDQYDKQHIERQLKINNDDMRYILNKETSDVEKIHQLMTHINNMQCNSLLLINPSVYDQSVINYKSELDKQIAIFDEKINQNQLSDDFHYLQFKEYLRQFNEKYNKQEKIMLMTNRMKFDYPDDCHFDTFSAVRDLRIVNNELMINSEKNKN